MGIASSQNLHKKMWVLNGPNLNLLGTREPAVYGSKTLANLENLCQENCHHLGLELVFRQSNHEGVLIDWVQEAGAQYQRGETLGLVLNAGAYTHTSLALADALKGTGLPFIEVHISQVYARESFRHHSYLAPLAKGLICGLGLSGYTLAIQALGNPA
jgi:3-dehydroquinate dehydratase-2